MKKHGFLLTALILCSLSAAACGAEKNTYHAAEQDETSSLSETVAAVSDETETVTSEAHALKYSKALDLGDDGLTPEVKGDEEVKEYQIIQTAEVRNQPDTEGKVLGTVDTDKTIRVLGTAGDSWAKVIYNGHIAYLPAAALPDEVFSSEEETSEAVSETSTEAPVTTAAATTAAPQTWTTAASETAPADQTQASESSEQNPAEENSQAVTDGSQPEVSPTSDGQTDTSAEPAPTETTPTPVETVPTPDAPSSDPTDPAGEGQ